MTLAELRAELSARGFSHLSDDRLDLLVNRARARLDSMYDWYYTEDSAQGAAPLSVPTLRRVEAVSNETGNYLLEESSYADILDMGTTDLVGSGQAIYWYLSAPSGTPVVNTYPDNADTIGVQFFASQADLSADGDESAMPERFHPLIVALAQVMAEEERGNFQASQILQASVDRQIGEMVEELLPQQKALYQRITWSSEDW